MKHGLSDTDPETAQVHLDLLRAATPARRLRLAFSLSRTVMALSRNGLTRTMAGASSQDVDLRLVALRYGSQLAEESAGVPLSAKAVSEPDLLVALAPVLDAMRRIGVRHYVGGSIASSAHGVPRASIDADVVAELLPVHAAALVSSLRAAYYVPEHLLHDAIGRRASFSVIHLETMVKVVVFVPRDRPFDRRALERSELALLEGGDAIPVSSPEDTVLAKLEWFRRGGEVSERQWTDVTGLLRTATTLDRPYLLEGAREIGVADLLQHAMADAGMAPPPPD